MHDARSTRFQAPLVAAAQHPGDRLMHPRVYLQVTDMLRCDPQLYAAIGAHMGGLGVPGRIFHGDSEQPLADWPPAYLAFIFH